MSKPGKKKNDSLQEIEQGELTHVSKKKVPYKIVHGWNPTSSIECDILWKQGWLDLLKQIQQAESDETKQSEILASISTEDIHWDWFTKAVACTGDEYEWFHLYASGNPQAACLIYHPEASALEPGDIFYVKFVAVAPWNRDCALRPREFCGLGKIILRAAQRFAVKELKLRPGFCLHSLPAAEVVYRKLKMVKVVGKEDAQSLAYYELPQAIATQLMEATDMSTQSKDWADFTHTMQTSKVSAHELFERFREFQGFIAGLSRKELVSRGWLKTVNDDSPLATAFFGLPLSKQPTLFRKSAKADENLLAIWQVRARTQAEYLCVAEKWPAFTGLTKDHLRKLAMLSVDPQVVRQLPLILAKFGIILVYIYALPGMKADGAVFHLSTGHPVIAMSLRFPRLDYFWFTLLHELAHLVLHADQLKEPVFFNVEDEEKDLAEKAANRLAKDSLVDRESWASCDPKYDSSDRAVLKYAAQEGVHAAIVAGLLRRESGNYTRYSKIINEHDVREIIFQP